MRTNKIANHQYPCVFAICVYGVYACAISGMHQSSTLAAESGAAGTRGESRQADTTPRYRTDSTVENKPDRVAVEAGHGLLASSAMLVPTDRSTSNAATPRRR